MGKSSYYVEKVSSWKARCNGLLLIVQERMEKLYGKNECNHREYDELITDRSKYKVQLDLLESLSRSFTEYERKNASNMLDLKLSEDKIKDALESIKELDRLIESHENVAREISESLKESLTYKCVAKNANYLFIPTISKYILEDIVKGVPLKDLKMDYFIVEETKDFETSQKLFPKGHIAYIPLITNDKDALQAIISCWANK